MDKTVPTVQHYVLFAQHIETDPVSQRFTSLVSEPQATKSASTLSPTKFFSLVWPLKTLEAVQAFVSHNLKVLSVEAETSSVLFR